MMRQSGSVAAIDIGTSRVVCAQAVRERDGSLNFLGIGEQSSRGGLRNGIVIDIGTASEAVRHAVSAASEMSGRRIQHSIVSLSGEHLQSMQSRAMVKVNGSEITDAEVRQVLEAAQAVPRSAERSVLHTLPSQYLVDGHEGVRKPEGMAAVRLDVDALVVTADANVCLNLEKVLGSGQLQGSLKIASGLCAAAAVLNSDEMQMGAVVLDIGAGTSDLAVFRNGSLQMLAALPVGGDMVTGDIVRLLRIPTATAEDLKLRFGSVLPSLVGEGEMIEVTPGSSGTERTISRQSFAEIIGARYREILQQVQARLQSAGIESSDLSSIVLTGGGARVESLRSLAEEIFHCAVRVGVPSIRGNLEGIMEDPSFASVIGAMRFATELPAPFDCCFAERVAETPQRRRGPVWWNAIQGWLKENY